MKKSRENTASKDILDDEKVVSEDDHAEINISDDDTWKIIEQYFAVNGLLAHQLDAYDNFIYYKAQESISSISHIHVVSEKDPEVSYEVDFGELIFEPPKYEESDGKKKAIYPMECIYRNLTYAASIYRDITVIPPGAEPQIYPKVFMGLIPVMVKSVLCNLKTIEMDKPKMYSLNEDPEDKGGYFVVSPKADASGKCAQRRIVICEERSVYNRVLVYHHRKKKPKWPIYAEVKSNNYNTFHTTTTTIGTYNVKGSEKRSIESGIHKGIFVILPWIDVPIPLGIVFIALGATDPQNIAYSILGPNWRDDQEVMEYISHTLEYDHLFYGDRDKALCYIGKKGKKFTKSPTTENTTQPPDRVVGPGTSSDSDAISYAKHLLEHEFLSNVTLVETERTELEEEIRSAISKGINESLSATEYLYLKKRYLLGYMVKRLLWVILGRSGPDDRDNNKNKRLVTVDQLLAHQLYIAFRRMITEITNNLKKAMAKNNLVDIISWIKPNIITNAMNGALSSNNWGMKGQSKSVSQLYEQYNHLAGLANPRKITVPISPEGSGNMIAPRDLNSSHFGLVCPSDTPEGKTVGISKNLALTAKITLGSHPETLTMIVHKLRRKPSARMASKEPEQSSKMGSLEKPPGSEDTDREDAKLVMTLFEYDLNISRTSGKKRVSKERKKEKINNTSSTLIFLNGDIIGVTFFPEEVIYTLKNMKRCGDINFDTSISYHRSDGRYFISSGDDDTMTSSENVERDDHHVVKEIRISVDAGRSVRPLLVVDEERRSLKITKPILEDLEYKSLPLERT